MAAFERDVGDASKAAADHERGPRGNDSCSRAAPEATPPPLAPKVAAPAQKSTSEFWWMDREWDHGAVQPPLARAPAASTAASDVRKVQICLDARGRSCRELTSPAAFAQAAAVEPFHIHGTRPADGAAPRQPHQHPRVRRMHPVVALCGASMSKPPHCLTFLALPVALDRCIKKGGFDELKKLCGHFVRMKYAKQLQAPHSSPYVAGRLIQCMQSEGSSGASL
eukprot:scaffold5087_cov430-Prasinococcus_capsulatus_cf.AAC.8